MDNSDKIIEGLERAYLKLIEFKKFKKTPIIVSKDGKVIELNPNDVIIEQSMYKRLSKRRRNINKLLITIN